MNTRNTILALAAASNRLNLAAAEVAAASLEIESLTAELAATPSADSSNIVAELLAVLNRHNTAPAPAPESSDFELAADDEPAPLPPAPPAIVKPAISAPAPKPVIAAPAPVAAPAAKPALQTLPPRPALPTRPQIR